MESKVGTFYRHLASHLNGGSLYGQTEGWLAPMAVFDLPEG